VNPHEIDLSSLAMIEARVAELDTHLFDFVGSQTTQDDRKSLLALHNALAVRGQFSYLEIGSHVGGTLQAVLADPRCVRVVSIDPRPSWQPDDRPHMDGCRYPDNSTERMLELLRKVPDCDLSKLDTLEESTDQIAPERLAPPDLCFIDGEHTYSAALRDARFCRTVMQGAGILVFHDRAVIGRAMLDFLRETPRPRCAYELRSMLFVVELGPGPSLLRDVNVRTQLTRPRWWMAADRVRGDATLLSATVLARRMRDALAGHGLSGSSR
jgi:hypothetical protein